MILSLLAGGIGGVDHDIVIVIGEDNKLQLFVLAGDLGQGAGQFKQSKRRNFLFHLAFHLIRLKQRTAMEIFQ